LFPHLLHIGNSTLLQIINGNLVLAAGIVASVWGYRFGQKLHKKLKYHLNWHKAESMVGLTLSLGSALIIIWLLAAGIGTLPFGWLSNSANNSFIVKKLNLILPAAPAVFAEFAHYVNPNYPMQVYDKLAPNSSIGVAPVPKGIPGVIKNESSKIVRITSFGCGGIVDGSGFLVGNDLIATNAHVIAGISKPVVKVGSASYVGNPVLFDPNQDLALIRISGLKDSPLTLSNQPISIGQTVYAAGFPEGIYTISAGRVTNNYPVVGSNIYGLGSITWPSYELAIKITHGSSGGPLLESNGVVIGIIFAQSKNKPGLGYAMTTTNLLEDITKVGSSVTTAGTGNCYVP
ncbi:MAG: trypsin-like peptidase domain-containing protein, partial [Candidatus Saccharimonadales bacterium]